MYQNISLFLGALFGQLSFYHPLNATEVNSFYPGLNDTQVLDAVICNVLFHWCALHFALRKKGPNNHVRKIVQRNYCYGVKHLSQVGSRMYTGTPMVCPRKLAYLSPQANIHICIIILGAKFPNLQPVNDLGVVWHGSGCTSGMSCKSYKCSNPLPLFLAMMMLMKS